MFCCLFHVDFLRLNHIIQSSLSRCFSFSDTLTGIHAVSREREKQGQCLCIACPEINSPIVPGSFRSHLSRSLGTKGAFPLPPFVHRGERHGPTRPGKPLVSRFCVLLAKHGKPVLKVSHSRKPQGRSRAIDVTKLVSQPRYGVAMAVRLSGCASFRNGLSSQGKRHVESGAADNVGPNSQPIGRQRLVSDPRLQIIEIPR